jgi:hypothetical protein
MSSEPDKSKSRGAEAAPPTPPKIPQVIFDELRRVGVAIEQVTGSSPSTKLVHGGADTKGGSVAWEGSPAPERETHKKSDEDPDHLVHAALCEVCHRIKQQRNTDRGELRKFRAEVESLRAERDRLKRMLESANEAGKETAEAWQTRKRECDEAEIRVYKMGRRAQGSMAEVEGLKEALRKAAELAECGDPNHHGWLREDCEECQLADAIRALSAGAPK